uniref:Uncharacterized protein n=1 Tax=Anguilla anguilla TaxID=7936 RepID=A0A0E9XEN2_ANGAN
MKHHMVLIFMVQNKLKTNNSAPKCSLKFSLECVILRKFKRVYLFHLLFVHYFSYYYVISLETELD